jgi:hypothetical protein
VGIVNPHDPDTERLLLASMIHSTDALERCLELVTAEDFYVVGHMKLFDAVARLHADGVEVRLATLVDAGVAAEDVTALSGERPATTQATLDRLASVLVNLSTRRRFLEAALAFADAAREGGDADVLLDGHIAALERIELPLSTRDRSIMLDELLDRPDDQRSPWVVPGLLRRDWRAIVVATEGAGKTLMLQQMALAASQGVHPFSFTRPHRPVNTLLVDVENPDERIQDGCRPIREVLTRITDGWEPRTRLWQEPGGINLRSRSDVAALEAILAKHRPELVCMGPVYKLADRAQGEPWDEHARSIQTVLDKLRTRYRFALLLEDHAPQGDGTNRDLRPFGSSMWLRWPELGLKLVRQKDRPEVVVVDHWRGARLKHAWPDELHRGGQGSLPWVGKWNDGGLGG